MDMETALKKLLASGCGRIDENGNIVEKDASYCRGKLQEILDEPRRVAQKKAEEERQQREGEEYERRREEEQREKDSNGVGYVGRTLGKNSNRRFDN